MDVSESVADIIVLENIHKSFGELVVLRGITIRVRRGETLVIIGQSGTGKSVTLRIIIGLLRADSGRALVDGKEVSTMNDVELAVMREHFAMLFQGGALFDSMTVGENVAFGLRAKGEKNAQKIASVVSEKLCQVGLAGTEDKMPSELSGGMKKRAALARAIAVDPNVVLYDEPTTGLDPIMSDSIADLIISTREALRDRNLTSVVVTHDMHVALKTADRIIMLHKGEIVGEGSPDYFQSIREKEQNAGLSEQEIMIRQFTRGEAEGPI